MQFVVSSAQLLKNLSMISSVVSANPVIPILENFLLDIADGTLTATASDLQTTAKISMAVEAEDAGTVAVPAKIFLETLKNLPEQPITITIDEETYSIEILSENGRYKVSGSNAVDFPRVPAVANAFSITLEANAINRALSHTLFATSNDDMRPSMSGVFMQLKTDKTVFASTDGHRLVRYTRNDISSPNETSILLPRKALMVVKGLMPTDKTPVKLNFNSSNAFFEFANIELICRLIDERFPEYENAIPLNNINVMSVEKQELLNSLRRISIYSNKATNQVRFSINTTELQISAEDLDYSNEASEKLACEYNNAEPIDIGFSSKLMIEMLSNINSNLIDLEMSAPNKAALIVPKTLEEGEEILMLIMPVMLSTNN
jgi:DNA polymerase-3 subunit beta